MINQNVYNCKMNFYIFSLSFLHMRERASQKLRQRHNIHTQIYMQIDLASGLSGDVTLGTHNCLKGVCVGEFSLLHFRLLHGSTYI